MTHIMVDTETFGTHPGCAIRSVGACVFDPSTGEIGARFYANVEPGSCEAAGLTVDPKTAEWWASQPRKAVEALQSAQQPLFAVLEAFSGFYGGQGGTALWCHGAGFDEPILRVAYKAVGLTSPWHYRAPRDTRTLFDLAGYDCPPGVLHHALGDAENQVGHVATAWAMLFGSQLLTPKAPAAGDQSASAGSDASVVECEGSWERNTSSPSPPQGEQDA